MTRLLTGVGVLALVALLFVLYGASRYHSGQLAERAIWQAKTALATLDDTRHANAVDTAQTAATQESTDDLKAKLADALALAAARPRRVCHAASGVSLPDMPSTPETASGAATADPAAIVDAADDQACAVNTVKAESWLAWWGKVSAIPR